MGHGYFGWWDDATHAVDVAAGEFVVATAAAADIEEFTPLSALLQRVRQAFGIEAAFVSDRHAERATDALQQLYGLRLLQADGVSGGRFRYEAVPVVNDEGGWHGTLCCRCADPVHEGALRSVAQLIANWFDQAQAAPA
jgi:hypothetical protein